MGQVDAPAFGTLLKHHRTVLGLTQEELAERAGLSVRAISDLERELHRLPRLHSARHLATALELSVGDRATFLKTAAGLALTATEPSREPLQVGAFLGALPRNKLVAREAEMTLLRSAIETAEAGVRQLVVLCGEPGVGKTRLAQEVGVELRARGFLIATGRCYEPERRVPFYPMLEVLATLYRAAHDGARSAVSRHWPDLYRLLPGEEMAESPPVLDRTAEQHHLFLAVSAFLRAVTTEAPIAILIDDLHWADTSSLALLRHLVRHTPASRILVLGTYRETEVGRNHALRDTLVDLRREDLVERVPVERLPMAGTAALVAVILDRARISDDLAQLVHEHTAGNAFFTQEVVRTLVERGDVYQQEDWWLRRPTAQIIVPVTVRELIVQRLNHLEDRAGEILCAASVLGQTFRFDELRAMLPLAGGLLNRSDVEEDRLEETLEAAIHGGFLRSLGPNEYAFEHALTQQALYDDMSARRKKRLHAAAGIAIESSPRYGESRAAELVRHFLVGEEPRRALTYALLAGTQAERVFAHAEGEQHFRLASTLARDEGEEALEAAALEGLGTVLKTVGRYDDALTTLQRAIGLYDSAEDLEAMGRVGALVGETHFWRGSWEEGIATIQPLLDRLESQGPSHALAALYLAMSPLYAPTARHHDQLAAAARASELAELQGDVPMLVKSEAWRGVALDELNRFAESRRVLLEVLPLAEEFRDLRSAARILGYLGHGFMVEGHLDDAVSYRRRALAANERVGDPTSIAWAEARLGEVLYIRGHWQEAANHLQHAIDVFGTISPSARHAAVASVHLGALFLMMGKWEEASRHLEEGIVQAVRANHIGALHTAQWALTDLEASPGYPMETRRRFLALLQHSSLEESAGTLQARVLSSINREQPTRHDALAIASQMVTQMAGEGRRLDLVIWLRLRGMALVSQSRWTEAADMLTEAVSLARSMPYPYAEARALYNLGCVLQEQGACDEAKSSLESALATFRQLGAIPYIELAEAALGHG